MVIQDSEKHIDTQYSTGQDAYGLASRNINFLKIVGYEGIIFF
jgi:hypothetical protein